MKLSTVASFFEQHGNERDKRENLEDANFVRVMIAEIGKDLNFDPDGMNNIEKSLGQTKHNMIGLKLKRLAILCNLAVHGTGWKALKERDTSLEDMQFEILKKQILEDRRTR